MRDGGGELGKEERNSPCTRGTRRRSRRLGVTEQPCCIHLVDWQRVHLVHPKWSTAARARLHVSVHWTECFLSNIAATRARAARARAREERIHGSQHPRRVSASGGLARHAKAEGRCEKRKSITAFGGSTSQSTPKASPKKALQQTTRK